MQSSTWNSMTRSGGMMQPAQSYGPCRRLDGTGSAAMALDAVDPGSTSLPTPPDSSPSSESPPESITCDGVETPSPLAEDDDPPALSSGNHLRHGLLVLNTEAAALSHLAHVYKTDRRAQDGFERAVQAVVDSHARGGKAVVLGVGKSGLIGQKLSRTLQSLGVPAVFLHPTEALHGDMGIIASNDVLLFITYSGRTPELLSLLPHLDAALPTVVLTSHLAPDSCTFLDQANRPGAVLLPAPVREAEQEATAFGVAAPMTSTTVALAVGDALAMAAARAIWGGVEGVKSVFGRNHPGGAIGMKRR